MTVFFIISYRKDGPAEEQSGHPQSAWLFPLEASLTRTGAALKDGQDRIRQRFEIT